MSKDEKAKRGHLLRWFKHREVCLVVLIGLVVCAVTLVDARFLAVDNLRDILVRSAPTLIVACGVMLVVVVGEIDISVGSLTALLAAAMGVMLSADHWSWPVGWAVPSVLLLGTLVGWGTGLLVTLGQVPSIIVTLGLLTALRGLAVMIMGGQFKPREQVRGAMGNQRTSARPSWGVGTRDDRRASRGVWRDSCEPRIFHRQ